MFCGPAHTDSLRPVMTRVKSGPVLMQVKTGQGVKLGWNIYMYVYIYIYMYMYVCMCMYILRCHGNRSEQPAFILSLNLCNEQGLKKGLEKDNTQII